jgi:uncharacterized membrane protein
MTPTLHSILVLLHLLGAVAWVGGMLFAHVVLRPAVAEVLEPPQRLRLMLAVFRRFFAGVAVAVAVILGTGFALLAPVGLAAAPAPWHLMLVTGLVMAGVFVVIYARLYPRMRRHVEASAWPAAAQVLARIRQLVATNLVLGLLTIAAAVAARG